MKLAQLEQRVGYHFRCSELLQQALTHRSFSADHNERLEFLGDSILDSIVGDYLFREHPQQDEGFLSRRRAAIVRGESLVHLARTLQLGQFLRLGKGEEKMGGRTRASILENAVEALIGAVFLDTKDWQQTQGVVLKLLADQLDHDSRYVAVKNYKSQLQEWLQAKGYALPEYHLVESTGVEHAQHFKVQCSVKALQLTAIGEGSSLKKSEQQAASQVLLKIEQAYE